MTKPVRLSIQDLGAAAFDGFRKVIQSETGINLRDSKRILVSNRLRKRLLALGLDSYEDYYDLLMKKDEGRREMPHFIDAISTNETYFYRGENQFEALRQRILPELLKSRRKLEIWSAGCSTGEEPYSILMVVEEAVRTLRWAGSIAITATDINRSVLEFARQGIYAAGALRNLPEQYLRAYLVRRDDGRFEMKSEAKERIIFKQQNLLKDDPPSAKFDIIFCRNVLMYFSRDTQETIINKRFAPVLSPDGYLFIGSSESFVGIAGRFEYARISGCPIYTMRDDGSARV